MPEEKNAGAAYTATGGNKAQMSAGFVLLVLGLAQFINAYDTTAMNVAISRIVQDLHTTVTGVQLALTSYSLVMAAFMIIGSKLGDIWGRKRTFTLGVAMYGTGALITALSPNLGIMIIGWSVLEGLGSALMIPSIFALVGTIFPPGKMRVQGYAIIGSLAAAGAALGPLFCGLLTTYLTWRVSFACEVVVALVVIILQRKLSIPKEEGRQTQLDFGGAVLSALGLAFVVMGVLQASNYGWLEARQPFKIGGIELIPQGGISPVVIFVAVGVLILVFFALWERHQASINKKPLVNLSIFRKRAASAGLLAILAMMFMQAGCLFVIPVFMQMALGYNALRTGLTLLPLSIAIILVASQSSKLVEKFAARALVQLGLLAMSVGVAATALTMTSTSSNWSFLPGLLIIGVGIGLANAPLLNLVQSSVPAKQQSEISGVNRAFSNLGGSLGIAVAGAILMASLMASLSSLVAQSPVLPTEDKPKLEQIVHKDARTVSNVQLSTYIKSEGPPQAIANELVKINAEARDGALRKALAAVGVLGLFGFAMSLLLPGRRRAEQSS